VGTISNTTGLILNDNIINKVYRTILKASATKGKIISNYIDTTHGKIEVIQASTIDIINNNIYNFSFSNPVAYRSVISYDNTSYGNMHGNVIDYGGSDAVIYSESTKVFITNNDINKIISNNTTATGLITNNITKYENEVTSTSVVND